MVLNNEIFTMFIYCLYIVDNRIDVIFSSVIFFILLLLKIYNFILFYFY